MKRFLLFVAFLVLAGIALGVWWIGSPQGPRLEDVAHLQDPHVVEIPASKVFEFTKVGAPGEVAGEAFGRILQAYFSVPGLPKFGPDMPAPRARWPIDPATPQAEWVGIYAMPVPDSVTSAPAGVDLKTWEYGWTAEILHVGPYDEETPTVNRLLDYVNSTGYEVTGLHEEVYLRSQGWLFEGNPDSYLTLIRYSVAKPDTSGAGV